MTKVKIERTTGGPGGWHPAIQHADNVVDRVWRTIVSAQPVITGMSEVGHAENSLHYGVEGDTRCRALDYRIHGITNEQRVRIDSELRRRLGTEFDVVWESTHLHIEYNPEPVLSSGQVALGTSST